MPEIVVPPLVPASATGSLSDLPHHWAQHDPGRALLARAEGEYWRDVSAVEFTQQVRALAKGFLAAGLEVGDRVGLMARTSYEWTLVDFALWTAGAVPVPVYESSSPEQVAWILHDSGAVAVVVGSGHHAAAVASVREEVPALRDVWQLATGALDELLTAGADVSEGQLDERRAAVDRSSPATIVYTSGTTGRPKGCLLTHGNFLSLAENTAERLAEVVRAPGARTLLFLPLAHVFARFVQVLVVHAGATLGHTAEVRDVLGDLGTFRPTFLLSVPRVLEKIHDSAQARAEAAGRGRIFAQAASVAQAWSRAQDAGGPTVVLRLRHAIFDRLVYARLRAALGGRLTHVVAGGAALGERLGHFYRGVGLVVLEGYGLTETTAPATVNTPDALRIGTVGRPLPGVGVRIAADGEVLVRGASVFGGYHGEAPRSGQDEWWRTGDLGVLDDEGFLTLTGRRKEILVTSSGKNVSPGPLEDRVRAHPLVAQCVVVGDGRPYVAALVSLDGEMLPGWAAARGLGDLDLKTAREHPAVQQALQEAIDAANTSVSRAESIRRFTVLDDDLTEAAGHLTPSMKLRRAAVTRDFADRIEALYTQSSTAPSAPSSPSSPAASPEGTSTS